MEEAHRVRAERAPARVGGAQIGEAQLVAQGMEDAPVADAVGEPQPRGDGLARERFVRQPLADRQKELVQFAVEP